MPSNDSGLGPISFSIDFIDTVETLDPQVPLTGLELNAEANITVNWNLGRTSLEADGVSFDPIIWLKCGAGPHDVFADQLGLPNRKKIGTIEWSLVGKVEKWVQKDGARFRQVVTVIPTLVLTRRTVGTSSPQIEIRQTKPTPCYGTWQTLPANLAGA